MELALQGKRAAVGASSSGLGFATAQALVSEGVHVALCGSNRERVEQAAKQLGERAIPLVADLTKPEGARQFVVDAREQLGGLDILVANGPGPKPGKAADLAPSDYQAALDVSLLSVVEMCYEALPTMLDSGWGRIVAITSVAVRQPIANLVLSNTARSGATGFLKSLALEYASRGVTVNSVQPGLHSTDRLKKVYGDGLAAELEQVPARAAGEPADFGSVVTFLCSEQAKYITGVALPVDGGAYLGLQ